MECKFIGVVINRCGQQRKRRNELRSAVTTTLKTADLNVTAVICNTVHSGLIKNIFSVVPNSKKTFFKET